MEVTTNVMSTDDDTATASEHSAVGLKLDSWTYITDKIRNRELIIVN